MHGVAITRNGLYKLIPLNMKNEYVRRMWYSGLHISFIQGLAASWLNWSAYILNYWDSSYFKQLYLFSPSKTALKDFSMQFLILSPCENNNSVFPYHLILFLCRLYHQVQWKIQMPLCSSTCPSTTSARCCKLKDNF